MKLKKWFETDLGFSATKKELRKSKEIAADFQDCRGRLTLHFIDLKDYTVQITTKQKLGIFYPETSNPQLILEKLKPYLVTAEGSPAKIIKEIPLKDSPILESVESSEKRLGFFGWLKWKKQFDVEQNEKELARLQQRKEELLELSKKRISDLEREDAYETEKMMMPEGALTSEKDLELKRKHRLLE